MWEKIAKLPRWVKLGLIFPLLCLNGVLFAFLINYLQPLVSFLVIASIIAFLLELLIELLVQSGSKRGVAIILVLLLALVSAIVILVILIPVLIQQLDELITNAPTWINQANDFIKSQLPLLEKFNLNINIESFIQEITEKLSLVITTLGNQTINIVIGTVTSIFNVIFILILTVFLLIGGKQFWEGIFSWIPQPWDAKIPQYLEKTFKDYFFSRLILAGLSSIVRAIAFAFIGVPSGLLFAFGIGIANLVPFAAGVVTLGGVLLLVFKSFKLAFLFWVVCTIIDLLTDQVIAPRLMGELIGLNPIWLIISLFIGAKLGGILGLFLAVPLASVIKKVIDDFKTPTSISKQDLNPSDD